MTYKELQRMSEKLEAPKDVQKTAEKIMRKGVEKGLNQSYGRQTLAEAALQISARQQQYIYNEDKARQNFKKTFKQKGLHKTVKTISRKLGEYSPPITIENYILKTVAEHDLSTNTDKALEITRDAREKGFLNGKNPKTMSAAIIYLTGVLENNYNSSNQVSELAQVTKPALRNNYNHLIEKLDLIQEFVEKHPHGEKTKWS